MYKVKLNGQKPCFMIDPKCRDYDWIVVFDELRSDKSEEIACPRERTILCTWEPVSIKSYSRAYTRQFGHLLTNRPPEAENHPHYHLGRGYFPWFIGRTKEEVKSFVLPEKTNLISTVCSSKQMKQTLHHARYVLTKHLSEAIPGFEWYGHGVKFMEKKSDALDTYKYHVAVENHIAPYHWSEKIADPILCECLTFYAGDPKLSEVLPPESFIPIPIDDPVEAERIIKAAIANNEYEKRLPAIREAKRLILEKYNFEDQVLEVIKASEDQEIVKAGKPVTIYARRELRKHFPLVAIMDGLEHLWRILKRGR